ncbi:MAG: hypothetical protein EOO20_09735 [Chryseobacterium sp.]|nr:MAG: hypothetical protein EOO20_09735 [Chryseobacterium sp.]
MNKDPKKIIIFDDDEDILSICSYILEEQGWDVKTFTDCKEGMEVWVTDKSDSLELRYANFNFERPYEPVYIEVEGTMVESGQELASDFDSTLIVHKVLTITNKIPAGACAD